MTDTPAVPTSAGSGRGDDPVTVIVFFGDHGASAAERLVAGGCEAAARDTIDLALACPLVDRVAVSTNSTRLAEALGGTERVLVELDAAGEPFHFGRALQRLVETHRIRRPLYFGAAAAPLLSANRLHAMCERLQGADRLVLANNAGSADFFGFAPPEALGRIPLPEAHDNTVPRLLSHNAGLPLEVLEASVETTFDVDTPTDLAVLGMQTGLKPHTARYVESCGIDVSRLEEAMPLLIGQHSRVTLIGRVNTSLWGSPDLGIPGPKRLFVEERAMKSYGRDERGEARTLLGDLYQEIGPARFFAKLADYSDVIVFDTRVLFIHLGLQLSAADRFGSDLGESEAISDPVAREFTAAAMACDVPVILGGHNVVSGALWALVQEAWDRADAGLLAVPGPIGTTD